MAMYSIDTHGELNPFLANEWLLTNGIGGFASSSVVGCNRRRYHGLLVAATIPPVGRFMTLNRVGELVYLDGKNDFLELSINRFGNSFHPRGDRYLRRFELDRTARWEYELEGVHITKELLLAWNRNAAALRYTVQAQPGRPVELHLLPFVSMRDFHALRRHGEAPFEVKSDTWDLSVRAADHELRLRSDAGEFRRAGHWWYGHTYLLESDRGLDDTEDLYVPGVLVHKMSGSGTMTLWFALNDDPSGEWNVELARGPEMPGRVFIGPPDAAMPTPQAPAEPSAAVRRLLRASADFVVLRRRPDGKPATSIIAGYPWFSDWGRDTMISLPGLLLTTGRWKEAGEALSLFADHVSEGMIPNRFDDYTNEPHYNTVDASLWFIHAAFEYLRMTGDKTMFDATLLPACRAIVAGYREGTRYNIHMDTADGLIIAGDERTQLTWMDAKHGDHAFTPRHGKAVEINALWYNALVLLKDPLAEKVRQSFARTFWMNPFRGLYDVVDDKHRDDSLRPNQILAVSLPNSPLDDQQQLAVVEVVRRELLTSYGLRTLAKGDPKYMGRCYGGPAERDRAYHNGTVWAWLIGPFLQAYLRVHQNSSDARRQARVWLQPLIDHLNQNCIGQINECFDADEPHRPVAAPAQAWSVAEVLRLAAELEM